MNWPSSERTSRVPEPTAWDAPGQLVEQECLAPAEVAEDQDEAALRGVDPLHGLRQQVAPGAVVGVEQPVPLGDVQVWRVDAVAAQLPGLLGDVATQVEDALVLHEADEPHAAMPGGLDELLVGRVAAVDQLGDDQRVGRPVGVVDVPGEPLQVGGADTLLAGADGVLAGEAVLADADPEVRQRRRGRSSAARDRGAWVAEHADLGHPRQEVVGLAARVEPRVAARDPGRVGGDARNVPCTRSRRSWCSSRQLPPSLLMRLSPTQRFWSG